MNSDEPKKAKTQTERGNNEKIEHRVGPDAERPGTSS